MADPSIPLFITDGQKKADALVSRGACAIALTGVGNWKSRSQYGGQPLPTTSAPSPGRIGRSTWSLIPM
ncbi:MAG: DUF3854 domain-containing protein [Chloroflexi bacterium]|nr:DUF3854 domain-containing protein [Chloroflexota bacterium]